MAVGLSPAGITVGWSMEMRSGCPGEENVVEGRSYESHIPLLDVVNLKRRWRATLEKARKERGEDTRATAKTRGRRAWADDSGSEE